MTAFKMAHSLTSESERAAGVLKGNMSVTIDIGGPYCLPQTTRTLLMRLKPPGSICMNLKKENHESKLRDKALTANKKLCIFFIKPFASRHLDVER